MDTYNRRYDICLDDMTSEEYREWTVDLFNNFDKVLSKTVSYYTMYHMVQKTLLHCGYHYSQ